MNNQFLSSVFFLAFHASTVWAQCPSVVATSSSNCVGGPIQLNASSGFTNYSWAPAGNVSNANIPNPIANVAGTYTVTATTTGPNLIVNPDISAGNVGFTSGHTFTTFYSPCNYYVGPNFFLIYPNLTDHTPTTDNMFIHYDGCTQPTILWQQSNIAIQPNTNYNFSFWASRSDVTQPNFEIQFTGNATGSTIVNTVAGIPYTGIWTWDQYGFANWNSGTNTSLTITITNLQTASFGNDFGLDDFVLETQCTSSDTIQVFAANPIYLGSDTTVCPNTSLTLNAGPANSYLWNTGDTTQSITINNTGQYIVTATIGNCTLSDTININSLTQSIDIGDAISLCGNIHPTLDAGIPNATYLWSTGASTQTIEINSAGTYWVEVTNGNCSVRDSIEATGIPGEGTIFVPNTFTPDNNSINERFTAYGTGIISFHMQIFNRWGQLIFETTDVQAGWDGMYKGKLAQEDTYAYTMEYKTSCGGELIQRKMGHVNIIK